MKLVEALLFCPLVGLVGDGSVAHRVNLDGLPVGDWATAGFATAVCGEHVQLTHLQWRDLRTRGTSVTRCKPCRDWRAS
jgi:hypothetical protein